MFFFRNFGYFHLHGARHRQRKSVSLHTSSVPEIIIPIYDIPITF